MKKLMSLFLFLLTQNAYSTPCTGVVNCSFEYAKLTNYELDFDKKVNFSQLTLINDTIDLNKENVFTEFETFLNDNMIDLYKSKSLKAVINSLREETYNYAPIVAVTKEDIPPFINPKGAVTLVYKFNKNYEMHKTKKVLKLSEKIKVTEFKDKVFASGAYEDARSFMEELIKEDNQ